ncbi:class I SAM-dependent methyltransferase [Candidatus Pelagibacter bacterium nBUS_49]|uniref:class I SAM-dependent methyltransferase n=1 Tax=Candidatus Pelagibacter bacterium nBUS_49 TaxID=3374196 RepID=UPI003EBC2E43
MDEQFKKIVKLNNKEYKSWIENQEWYQTINLNNGLKTSGKFNTLSRLNWLNKFNFSKKTVLDIGCNSGQYSFFAKKAGAKKVMGIDVNEKRIYQAKMLALNEELDVDFNIAGIEKVPTYGKFDVVICIAVVTEVENVLGALRAIRDATIKTAIIEMDLARPLLYLSSHKHWWKKDLNVSRLSRVAEMHRHKHAGWVIHPSLEMVCEIFGKEFEMSFFGKGLRYFKIVFNRK